MPCRHLTGSAAATFPGERAILIERDLSPLDGDLFGCVDADPDRVVVDLHDRDSNAFPDVKTLAKLPAQYQHDSLLLESTTRRPGILSTSADDRLIHVNAPCVPSRSSGRFVSAKLAFQDMNGVSTLVIDSREDTSEDDPRVKLPSNL
jgi:hypothetical protein